MMASQNFRQVTQGSFNYPVNHGSLPSIRACIFDMDGLLINTEDLYFDCMDNIFAKYNKPSMPWSMKPRMMGVPSAVGDDELYAWANLPISRDEFNEETRIQRETHYPDFILLPGAKTILENLKNARGRDGRKIEIAMASSSTRHLYGLKTSRPEVGDVLKGMFNNSNRVLGDNPGLRKGRGKPAPDIYLLALDAINARLEHKIKPKECLVCEDSVPGVETGRRAGMRVVWVPHPELKTEYAGREESVLAGRSRMSEISHDEESQLENVGDGYGLFFLESLVDFPYENFGIEVMP